MSSSQFERRLQILREIQEARLRLADAHLALGGRKPSLDEKFKLEALEIHLRELGQLVDELNAGTENSAGNFRERVTIQKVDDKGVWSDVATVWASVEILTRRPSDQTSEESPVQEFTASDDYRSVKLGEQIYTLTVREAQLIEVLHEAYKRGTPDVSGEHLLDRIGSGKRVRDVFATKRRHVFKALVRVGEQKGTFRLNLPKVPQ